MITVWLDRKLRGSPEELITFGLLAIAAVLILIAITAPAWLKLGAFVWALAP